ncbi:ATP-binding protein [Saccharothrix australiensis]|uniref:NB-ARC domain-containing protein n=1 Tax=Saccharothrix australiensis TaxID=2072 RepID=A0A495VXI7_9PSEU|nr:tetratricopeptide repeat protein [Saccharothrix australiensis]RKT54141.1 NB-ARC domain-containing protein [Saccharothrix australiensis]
MTDRDDRHHRSSDHGIRSEVSGSADEVVQARDVHGGVHFHASRPHDQWTVHPRQLPADVRGFVNRLAELERLDKILLGDAKQPSTIRLAVITGTAGVGKTSLAVHWAHRVRANFPDGQLYVNMRGYDPGPPVEPSQALEHFLRALDVPRGAIPVDLEAKASLFRSLLADRKVLVLLDNVATAAQARPLLPGTAECLTLVTSRSRLSSLMFRDGAHRLTLDMLTEPEAVTLLQEVTTDYRSGDEPDQMAELARLCGRLPLALRIAAERAAREPMVPLDALAQDLRDESGLWQALAGDDDSDAVRSVFAWSYRALTGESARFFRLLALHPGSTFSVPAAAALTGTTTAGARRTLDTLAGTHMLEPAGPGRYQFHDLLRFYAHDQARDEETDQDRASALRRVVTWYLHGADALKATLNPLAPRVELEPDDTLSVPYPTFATVADANDWYLAERPNLLAATQAAANGTFHDHAWRLAAILHHVYRILGPIDDWRITTEVGLRAARHAGNRNAEAELLESMATVCVQTHQLDDGARYFDLCLAACRETHDRLGEAAALNGLGHLNLRRRHLTEARQLFDQCLAIARELDSDLWQAVARGNLGVTAYQMGDNTTAIELARQNLAFHRAVGNPLGQGDALHALARSYRELGRHSEALQSIDEAMQIATANANLTWEAYWSIEQGHIQRESGRIPDALASYHRAVVLHQRHGDRSREAQALDGTGLAYRDLGRFKEAADFHRIAATIHQDLADHWHTALSLAGLAVVLDQLDEPSKARQHRDKALAAIADFTDPRAAALRRQLSGR